MQKNPIRFLGLVGLLGLLGLITGNTGLHGLIGFFGFFGLAHQADDEMFRHNLARAGLNAFIVSLLGFPVVVIVLTFLESLQTVEFLANYIGILFVVQILTFVLSFNIYEKRGDMR